MPSGCPCVWTAKEKAVGGGEGGGVTCLKRVSSQDFFRLFLNYHIPTGLKLDLEVAEERRRKRKELEFRMKYLWWKREKGDSKH